MERDGRLTSDQAGRFHLRGPQAVMRRDDELGVGKLRLQQLAELITVPRIDGHDDVVQQRDRETLAEQPLHQSKVETDPHAVLMAFAVIGGWWKQAALVEIDFEIEL